MALVKKPIQNLNADSETWRGYTSVLSSAARRSRWQEVTRVFADLRRCRLRPNVIIHNAGINAFGKGARWESALWLLDVMCCSGLVPTVISHNAFISSCDREARWPVALHSMCEMPAGMTDLITCNSAVSACSRSNWKLALAMACAMAQQSTRLDEFTCGSLLLASERHGIWRLAVGICADMRAMMLRSNSFTYSSALMACEGAAWQQAVLLLQSMEQDATSPNQVCYTAAIKACEKGGQWELALAIYAQAEKALHSRDRDDLLCDAGLRALQQGMQWQGALELVFDMSSSQLKPDALCFTSLIEACAKAGEWQTVLKIIAAMCDAGVDDFRIARYEHSIQAGSTLDCFKHSALAAVMQCMNADPRPYTYVDTHAGSAVYTLGQDHQHLILRLLESRRGLPWNLASYVNSVRHFQYSTDNTLYPGSPTMALQWMRPQDDALLFELSPTIFSQLKQNVQRFSLGRVKMLETNSYWWLLHRLRKQPTSRQLVLIDPPYEPYEAYVAWSLYLLQKLHDEWPSSCIILWYPYLDEQQIDGLYRRLEFMELTDVLIAEFGIAETSSLETSGWQSWQEWGSHQRALSQRKILPRAAEAMSPILPPVSLRAAQLAELRGTQIHKFDPAPCKESQQCRSKGLGLVGEAVEACRNFAMASKRRRIKAPQGLRLVDLWGQQAAADNLFYVDIANVHGTDAKKQHRLQCERRLEESLRSGRAEILNFDSAYAASQIADGELDFVYLDARHDFAGVVADIHAWWPKVRTGGIFAGHDFVDGEFPEGDFFWLAALQAVLPGVDGSTFIVREVNRYPSFFILKSESISSLQPLQVPTERKVRELYADRSRYFKLWVEDKSKSPSAKNFEAACNAACSRDCSERVAQFTPTRTSASTLRPFACGQGQDTCAAEVAVDVTAYKQVCLERCAVTCQQRLELFAAHGDQIQAAVREQKRALGA
ncbi:rlmJ [Symbiodinium sp. CCMP2456]|nr:rlmJ [Symbiodinium sp. CCMP2456]